ncbi:hypothetical protein [Spirosoma pollinicola]|uniref:Uncharacterized protein n=1 Tax=Spirosoma pollinicola TaxID=2057025 RepID=A0A2K8Z9Y4_9BACT|nr:hypothetical protein [Spirosoma pollinicola]AUD06696.1 hypothetical protein CWM47_35535 [Spirosoma pollinicola]
MQVQPADVQAGIHTVLQRRLAQYAHYYPLIDQSQALSVCPIIHAPEWMIWIGLKAQYQEDELGPILFIYELEELTKAEAEQSLAQMKLMANRLNPC